MSRGRVVGPAVAVVGGGAFGRALARSIARRQRVGQPPVLLWSRAVAGLGEGIEVVRELDAVAERELIFLAVPSAYVSSVLTQLGRSLDGANYVVHVSRGLLDRGLRPISAAVRELTACRRIGALAGPLSAGALASAKPAGAVVGSDFPEVIAAVRAALSAPSLFLEASDDLVGIELASALTGLLLVCVGFVQAREMGPCSAGILVARGIAEGARIGASLGARPSTFHGLACAGDLVAAIAGDPRPELAIGRGLARGRSARSPREDGDEFVEGLALAHDVADYCRRARIDAPIVTGLAALLTGEVDADEIAARLLRSFASAGGPVEPPAA